MRRVSKHGGTGAWEPREGEKEKLKDIDVDVDVFPYNLATGPRCGTTFGFGVFVRRRHDKADVYVKPFCVTSAVRITPRETRGETCVQY